MNTTITRAAVLCGLLAALAFCAAATIGDASSTAQPRISWLCGRRGITHSGECIVRAENVEGIVFEDRGLGTELSTECTVDQLTGEGSVGPDAEAKVTGIDIRLCTALSETLNLKGVSVRNMCFELESLQAVGLPWLAAFLERAGVPYVILLPTEGTAQPGFRISCLAEVAGLPVKLVDTCTSAPHHEALIQLFNVLAKENTNKRDARTPAAQFLARSLLPSGLREFETCTLGGAEAGIVRGELALTGAVGKQPATLELGG